MKVAAIAFTERGMKLGKELRDYPEMELTLTRCGEGMLQKWTRKNFENADALLFIGSTGIAVRAIAPFVQAKTKDPAVIVMDELGRFAIPILSGHIGGANKLSLMLSEWSGACPVITTATDVNGIFAVDTWAKSQGLIIANPERIKAISGKLLAGEPITIKSCYPIKGKPPKGVLFDDEDYDVFISHENSENPDALQLIAPVLTIGIGCKKGVRADAIASLYETVLRQVNCHPLAVCRVCSISLKAKETGLLDFCERRGLPFETFSASELAAVPGDFSGSPFVQSVTGIDNVCERAAVLGSGGKLLCKKEASCGVTIAIARQEPTLRY